MIINLNELSRKNQAVTLECLSGLHARKAFFNLGIEITGSNESHTSVQRPEFIQVTLQDEERTKDHIMPCLELAKRAICGVAFAGDKEKDIQDVYLPIADVVDAFFSEKTLEPIYNPAVPA